MNCIYCHVIGEYDYIHEIELLCKRERKKERKGEDRK
jgi:hypothetical protein